MRAMVLCAGLGTRLRPITDRWPKPGVPFFDGPLLRLGLETLERAGVTELGINTHHLAVEMERIAAAECDRLGWPLTVSHEAEIQGTGGGIRGLRNFLSSGDSLVLNGDVLFTFDAKAAVEAHRARKADATMVLLPMPKEEAYNAVELDAQGSVRRIAGKGPGGGGLTPWHFSGAHVLSPRVFDFIAARGPEGILDAYLRMIDAGLSVIGHRVLDPGVYWSDLGTPERYLKSVQDVLFGQAPGTPWKATIAMPAHVRAAGPVWLAPDCVLGEGVRLGAAVAIGAKAKIGAGAQLNRSVVLDGAEVPAGVLIEDRLIGP